MYTVSQYPQDSGHFVYLADPTGAHSYIIQLLQAEPWGE